MHPASPHFGHDQAAAFGHKRTGDSRTQNPTERVGAVSADGQVQRVRAGFGEAVTFQIDVLQAGQRLYDDGAHVAVETRFHVS